MLVYICCCCVGIVYSCNIYFI